MEQNLHFYENEKALDSDFVRLSNASGSTFVPVTEMSAELERAYSVLFNGKAPCTYCYLCEFKGRPGVMLEGTCCQRYHNDDSILVEKVTSAAERVASEFARFEVAYGTNMFLDGPSVMLFLPWDTPSDKFHDVQKRFDWIFHKLRDEERGEDRTSEYEDLCREVGWKLP